MKFTAWEARRHIENKYKTALRKLGRFLSGLIGETDDIDTVITKLNGVSNSKQMHDWSTALAKTIVTNTLEENAKTWRQAAAMSGQGNMIRDGINHEMESTVGSRVQELIDSNAKYIKTVPQTVTKDLVRHVQSKAFIGSRIAYKSPDFKRMVGDMTDNHARLISRTETSKAMAALTQARAESTGRDWYIWHSTHDQRVRDSHKHMDGVLCRFSDPPSPEELAGEPSAGRYSPGNIYNCRCFAAPVILWRTVTWPHDVHVSGQIVSMTKAEFENQFGAR
jgi:SPP1 gp7 family putative phage head morphogenesis protein